MVKIYFFGLTMDNVNGILITKLYKVSFRVGWNSLSAV